MGQRSVVTWYVRLDRHCPCASPSPLLLCSSLCFAALSVVHLSESAVFLVIGTKRGEGDTGKKSERCLEG